jgi:protein disulfide-isomerase-like protein
MSFLKNMQKEHRVLLAVLAVILLIGIFWPRNNGPNLSVGVGAHIGNLRGSIEVEAYANGSDLKPQFVMFYAPWCGHCKRIMPAFDQLGENYEGVSVLKVNCDDQPEMAKAHGIQGFPTLKFFQNGMEDPQTYVVYDGERNLDGLQSFIRSQLRVEENFDNVAESMAINRKVRPMNGGYARHNNKIKEKFEPDTDLPLPSYAPADYNDANVAMNDMVTEPKPISTTSRVGSMFSKNTN